MLTFPYIYCTLSPLWNHSSQKSFTSWVLSLCPDLDSIGHDGQTLRVKGQLKSHCLLCLAFFIWVLIITIFITICFSDLTLIFYLICYTSNLVVVFFFVAFLSRKAHKDSQSNLIYETGKSDYSYIIFFKLRLDLVSVCFLWLIKRYFVVWTENLFSSIDPSVFCFLFFT